jgi:hypothetical protein
MLYDITTLEFLSPMHSKVSDQKMLLFIYIYGIFFFVYIGISGWALMF